ncbi:ankyrin repeat-containing domain protein [Xylariomycetidae sp. FL2044]|nr:ankyrin repeat-containing domain protein [Xylariomycetidae sp. FL2044]
MAFGKWSSTEVTDGSSRTSLPLAVKQGFEEIVTSLLIHGANTEALDLEQRTPLLLAVQNGLTEIDFTKIVGILLEHGAITLVRTKDNRTPLLLAIERESNAMVEALLNHAPEISHLESGDSEGHTPFWIAASKGLKSIVLHLLAHGARLDPRGAETRTPLAVAAERGHLDVVSALLSYGADPNTVTEEGQFSLHLVSTPDILELLMPENRTS